jgi:hypothetical protein
MVSEARAILYAEFSGRSGAELEDRYVELAGRSTYHAGSTISRSASAGEATRNMKLVKQLHPEDGHA